VLTREKVGRVKLPRLLVPLAAVAFATAACTGGTSGNSPIGLDTTFSAQLASSWHWAGDPQRVQVGVLGSDANGVHFVSGGSVDLAFSFLGADGGGDPQPGPSTTATYVPVPGTEPAGDSPGIVTGARGVYQGEDLVFDSPGLWRVTVSADISGVRQRMDATFPVADASAIPAPGDRALRTENLTIDSKGATPCSIDSIACAGGEIPDPELHRWTIADAIREGRPVLVLFGTPAYCTSQMCGPEVQELQALAEQYPDRAVFIHVELWKDFDGQVLNEAAADWLYRDDILTDPWLYLIGADGVIIDRWGSLFDPGEVAADLEALPPMRS
jgi:hypothetical protein